MADIPITARSYTAPRRGPALEEQTALDPSLEVRLGTLLNDIFTVHQVVDGMQGEQPNDIKTTEPQGAEELATRCAVALADLRERLANVAQRVGRL